MRFWLALIIAFTVLTTNVVPESAHALTKTEKEAKAKKAKKASSSKKGAAKSPGRRSRASGRRSHAAVEPWAPIYSEFLVDSETGRILHQENATERRYPASLTKMMTIYLTFEQLKAGHLKMTDTLRISPYAASMPKTNLSLAPGDRLTVKEAILGLVVHSANDAAVVLAENIGGDEDRFAVMMTERAHQLGMNNTFFKNACGLHNPGQVTTAKDMALLAIALKKHYPEYYSMFATGAFMYNGREYTSHNRVTTSYPGAEGMKTGYVRASGFNLVTAASRSQNHLVGVVMGGRTAAGRDQRMKDLLDAGFDRMAEGKRKDKGGVAKAADNSDINVAALEPNGLLKKKNPAYEEPVSRATLTPDGADEEALNGDDTENMDIDANAPTKPAVAPAAKLAVAKAAVKAPAKAPVKTKAKKRRHKKKKHVVPPKQDAVVELKTPKAKVNS